MKKPKKSKLPDKPSELISVALADLTKVEKDRKYRVNMDDWHYPVTLHERVGCEVCLAGSVIAKSLGGEPEDWLSPNDFSPGVMRKLYAINSLRVGFIQEGLETMGIGVRSVDRAKKIIGGFLDVPNYNRRNPKPFKTAMRKLARDLRKAGL